MTRSTCVCCSMTSETRIAYGSRVCRQADRGRAPRTTRAGGRPAAHGSTPYLARSHGQASASRPARPARCTSATRSSAVANRRRGDWMLLRIDDTDPTRNVAGGERGDPRATSTGSGSSGTKGRCGRASARSATARPPRAAMRTRRARPVRPDDAAARRRHRRPITSRASSTTSTSGSRTSSAATTTGRTRSCTGLARGARRRRRPEYVHHGLLLGADGKKLSKRPARRRSRRSARTGIPAEAVRAYLEELGLPAHDVHLDRRGSAARDRRDRGAVRRGARRARRRAVAARAGAARRARPRRGARRCAASILEPEPVALPASAAPTLAAFPRAARGAGARRQREDRARAEGGRRRPEGAAARAHRPRARPRAVGGPRRPAARTRRCGGSMRLYNTSPARARGAARAARADRGCTSAARPSTRARTSATRGRSCSACGCGAGCARAATT